MHAIDRHDRLSDLRRLLPAGSADLQPPDLFYTLAWFENLERHGIDRGDTIVALRWHASEGRGAAAALPLRIAARGQAAVYGPVLTSLSNYYSSLYGPVGDTEALTTDACRALLRFLRRQTDVPGVIDLQPLDVDGPFFTHMEAALQAEGFIVDRYFCFGNWHLDVAGRSFEQYFPGVPSRIRNTIRRGRKKLDDSGDWSLRILDGSEPDLEAGIADFDAVYRRSWKVPEPFPDFVPNLIRTAAHCGWLRLGVVRVGSTPIAAQLWLVRDGRALIYKLAYDEEHKRYSAGSVLTAELFRHVIDHDRVYDIDYLTGDDAYKADWMSHRRERHGLVAFDPRTVQGLVSAGRHLAARRLGRWRHLWHREPAPPAAVAAAAAAATTSAESAETP